jgi:hypothetical protein
MFGKLFKNLKKDIYEISKVLIKTIIISIANILVVYIKNASN